MALVINNRVKETTSTSGVGTITTAGAVASFRSFGGGIGDGNTTFYLIESGDGVNWEAGTGVVSVIAGVTSITRVPLDSSMGGAAIPLVGISTVFCDLPASVLTALIAGSTQFLAMLTAAIRGLPTTLPSQPGNLWLNGQLVALS